MALPTLATIKHPWVIALALVFFGAMLHGVVQIFILGTRQFGSRHHDVVRRRLYMRELSTDEVRQLLFEIRHLVDRCLTGLEPRP
jgi:hypothetical protein